MDQNPKKWEAKVSTKLPKTTADQIWPLLEDFFGINKYFPGLATCHGIHGNNGEPGCIRYCAGFGLKRQNGAESGVSWSKERLVYMDREQMKFSYEIVDSNVGFENYVSSIEVVRGEGEGGGGCVVEWRVGLDAVEGWKFEDLVNKYQVGLIKMVENMVDAISQHE